MGEEGEHSFTLVSMAHLFSVSAVKSLRVQPNELLLLLFFIQQVLISHQFYTHQCIHVNPNRPIHHTTSTNPLPLSPRGVHMFVLYMSVSTSALQTGSSVPFF